LFSALPDAVSTIAFGFLMIASMALLDTIVLSVYIPELFPTPMRVRAASIAIATSRAVPIGLSFGMAAALKSHGTVGAMAFVEGCLSLVVISVLFFGKETARQSLK